MGNSKIWEARSQEKADLLRQNVSHLGITELHFLYSRALDHARVTGKTTREAYLEKLRLRASYDLVHVPQQFHTHFSAKVAYQIIELGKYTSNPKMPHFDEVVEGRVVESLDAMVEAEDRMREDSQEEFPLTADHARSW
jgi:hypothetical protein